MSIKNDNVAYALAGVKGGLVAGGLLGGAAFLVNHYLLTKDPEEGAVVVEENKWVVPTVIGSIAAVGAGLGATKAVLLVKKMRSQKM